jgi:hypothetical protein
LILTTLISQVSKTTKNQDKLLLDLVNQDLSDEEMLALGVLPARGQREN